MGRPPPPERGHLMPQPAVQSVRPAVPTPLPSFCSPRQSSVPQLPHDGPSRTPSPPFFFPGEEEE